MTTMEPHLLQLRLLDNDTILELRLRILSFSPSWTTRVLKLLPFKENHLISRDQNLLTPTTLVVTRGHDRSHLLQTQMHLQCRLFLREQVTNRKRFLYQQYYLLVSQRILDGWLIWEVGHG